VKHAFAIAVVVLFAVCASSALAATPEQRMVDAVNHARHHQGLRDLRASRDLERSAGAFAHYLIRHQQVRHRPRVSVTRNYPHCGEALALHFSLAAQIGGTVREWLGSPVHRGLVLTTTMNLVGIGHASGRLNGQPRTIWVLQVARRR
jgi:uncharacterized protein YkwD